MPSRRMAAAASSLVPWNSSILGLSHLGLPLKLPSHPRRYRPRSILCRKLPLKLAATTDLQAAQDGRFHHAADRNSQNFLLTFPGERDEISTP